MLRNRAFHPPALTALAIIRSRPERHVKSEIRACARFTATIEMDGPRFYQETRLYPAGRDRADIIADILSAVPSETTVLMRCPAVPTQPRLRHALISGSLPPLDVQLLPQMRGGRNVLPVQIAERALAEVAESAGLMRASRNASISRRTHCAGDEAQTLWLAFLCSSCSPQEQTHLATA